jgi:CRISPR-associated endonuclease Cas1
MDALRGIEGRAAQAYFTAWRSIPLRWNGLGRKPIPDEWPQIGPRVRPNSKRNRDATHPVNAMLNYGYAVLESRVRTAVVAIGLDPTIGFMHAAGEGRSALVLDLIEPMRPIVDRAVLGMTIAQAFYPADFMCGKMGCAEFRRGWPGEWSTKSRGRSTPPNRPSTGPHSIGEMTGSGE